MIDVTLPRFTRASDIRSLNQCSMQYVLEKAYQDELDDAGYFHLGTALHLIPEQVALNDISLETGIKIAKDHMDAALYDAQLENRKVRWTKKRTEETWPEDIERMATKWWNMVHPSSEDRHPRYRQFKWPFIAEHVVDIEVNGHRVHTTVDAIFEHKSEMFRTPVDWKSGATAKAADIQLWTYWAALEWENIQNGDNELPIVEAWFHHMDFNKLQDAEDLPAQELIMAWIAKTQGDKERGEFLPSPDWYCNYCRVQDRCVIWSDNGMPEFRVTFVDDPEVYYGEQEI